MPTDYQKFLALLDKQIKRRRRGPLDWPPVEYVTETRQHELHILVTETDWVFSRRTGALIGMCNYKG
jgi:hypothetical protein